VISHERGKIMKSWRLDDPLSLLVVERDLVSIRRRLLFTSITFAFIGVFIGSIITIALLRAGWTHL
jgi:hypothetical protein